MRGTRALPEVETAPFSNKGSSHSSNPNSRSDPLKYDYPYDAVLLNLDRPKRSVSRV